MTDEEYFALDVATVAVRSSNIARLGFAAAETVDGQVLGTLQVQFTGGSARYRYARVPEETYRVLLAEPSIGAAFQRLVRGRFPTLKEA